MQISGFEKLSLIDYAPNISCVVFTQGCNLMCPYCHNPELVPKKSSDRGTIPEEVVYSFLKKRKQILDGVVISGGEPTLHPDLYNFCLKIKSLGYLIKLDSNGTRPDVIEKLIAGKYIDYIAMDVKADPASYSPHITYHNNPAAIYNSIAIILESGIGHEFRTTCVKPFIDREAISVISGHVRGADLYALQHPVLKNSLNPSFFDRENRIPSEQEMAEFQSILSRTVSRCIIR